VAKKKAQAPVLTLADQLKVDLEALTEAATNVELTPHVRRQLEARMQEIGDRLRALVTDLDPLREPKFVFDASDPRIVGRFVAIALLAQVRVPLSQVDRFYGSGVYAIYYKGPFSLYAPISGTETPIYVGKVDPARSHAKNPKEQGERLHTRLKDHRGNIMRASTTLDIGDFEYRSLVVQTGYQSAAENYLIQLFRPVWNKEMKICYGFGKHGDSADTRGNKRSPWDTVHLGRVWARSGKEVADAVAPDKITENLGRHFATTRIFGKSEEVVREFLEELGQV
jgi:hypothetical protein